jgi:hypothetical protein
MDWGREWPAGFRVDGSRLSPVRDLLGSVLALDICSSEMLVTDRCIFVGLSARDLGTAAVFSPIAASSRALYASIPIMLIGR